MTKVEELRERLIQAIGTYGVAEDKGMPSELCETLDSLIAAVREEQKQEYDKLLEHDNYLLHYNGTLVAENNQLAARLAAVREVQP